MTKTLSEQLEERSAIYFGISRCPQPVYRRFIDVCKKTSDEQGITYVSFPAGLKALLDVWDAFHAMKQAVVAEEKATKDLVEPKKEVKKLKTFGRKEE